MENVNRNEICIKIEGTEYKVEQAEEFASSYFRNEYLVAFQAANAIIHQNDKRKAGDCDSLGGQNNRIHNLIPFVGKRGVGKTSAMLSFANALKSYTLDDKKIEEEFYCFRDKDGKKKSVHFTCMKCIDGSLLEEGEDIFKIVLAQMYGGMTDLTKRESEVKDWGYELRTLQQQFEKIYRGICELENEGHRKGSLEEAPIVMLQNLSSSLSLRETFDCLVQNYLKLLRNGRQKYQMAGCHPEEYLVLVIDDIDLNISSGYDMLEKIHRYMMVRNLIVLLAVDYDQMKILCEKSFYRMVPEVDEQLRLRNPDVERLSRDFLDKVLPFNVRVYLPRIDKADNVMIKIGEEGREEGGQGPKRIIFKLLYRRFGMRLDTEGSKRHFFVPTSLRALVNFCLMLKEMESVVDLKESDTAFLTVYEHNYRILMSDIIVRMVDERLSAKEKRRFERITELGTVHACRNLYLEVMLNSDESTERATRDLLENLKYYDYSYGELLRIIYCWGRVDVEKKEMVRCLLAFYSLELTHEYFIYRSCRERKGQEDFSESDEIIGKRAKRHLDDILNGSFGGSWANKLLPKQLGSGEETEVGAVRWLDMGTVFCFQLDFGELPVSNGKLDAVALSNEGADSRPMEEVRKLFRSILVLGMFFDQPHYKTRASFQWEIEVNAASDYEGAIGESGSGLTASHGSLEIHNKEGKGIFNVFNFVTNAFQYEVKVVPLIESLCDCLFEGPDNKKQVILEKLGIGEEFRRWERHSGGCALPFYDMDFCYNLMKRLRQEMYDVRREGAAAMLKAVRDLFGRIEDKLARNDDWYAADKVSERKEYSVDVQNRPLNVPLKEAFSCCPYIKWFRDDRCLTDNFGELFSGMMEDVGAGSRNAKREIREFLISGIDD